MNRKIFYDLVRQSLFKGAIAYAQTAGMDAILAAWEARGRADLRHLSYMLATTFHETSRTMQPIREKGGANYFRRMYDKAGSRPDVARKLGNTQAGDGARFCGRGYVQLTGRANYAKASKVTGHDLVANPDLAMQPAIAAEIMFHGMANGWFTGKKLADYFSATKTDWVNARKIINALDKASPIAGYARAFNEALDAAAKPYGSPEQLRRSNVMRAGAVGGIASGAEAGDSGVELVNQVTASLEQAQWQISAGTLLSFVIASVTFGTIVYIVYARWAVAGYPTLREIFRRDAQKGDWDHPRPPRKAAP